VGEKVCVKEGAIERGNSGAREERVREKKRKPESARKRKLANTSTFGVCMPHISCPGFNCFEHEICA